MKVCWNRENKNVVEDLISAASDKNILWDRLEGKSILITGATGLIGSLLVKTLLYYADLNSKSFTVGAFVRNIDKANSVFGNIKEEHDNLIYEIGDLSSELTLSRKYDFIIHAASITASKFFIEKPVETILTTIESTKNFLQYSLNNQVKSIVYISSMEVYGEIPNETVKESDSGLLDWMNLRSSYPQSKRLAETLCLSYFNEYSVPVKIVRPTLTFGPGISKEDNRVFAQFAKAVLNKTDITLLTKGNTKRDYLYTIDAIVGILTVLLNGKDGEAYNLSNPDTYCTIYEMAQLCCELADNQISVNIDLDPEKSKCYPKEQKIQLDNAKYLELNPSHKTDLKNMYINLLKYLEDLNTD
jgi:nucleoside-diphosphate-sugar epimerase